MICLLPTSPRKIRNDGEAVTSPPFLNPTTMKGSGESMGNANSVKLSLKEQSTKVCTKCGEEKSVVEFYKKHSHQCKKCLLRIKRKKDKKNKKKISQYWKKWYQKNAGNVRKYQRNREINDIQYNLTQKLRCRLRLALRQKSKSGSSVRDLGCDIPHLINHLEQKFDHKMTWGNCGKYWHIDHVFPIALADLENRAEFLAVSNWRNLQPLSCCENIKKKDKATPAARRLFNKLVKEFSK